MKPGQSIEPAAASSTSPSRSAPIAAITPSAMPTSASNGGPSPGKTSAPRRTNNSEDGEHAAVDVDDLPVDVVRRRRGEEDGGTAELGGIAPPAGGHARAQPCVECGILLEHRVD